MATLTKVQYKALYGTTGTEFPDNTSGQISESDMRSFGENQADSLLFVNDVLGSSVVAVPLVDCGDADLSTNLFPETGGTGSAGAIKKGNLFRVSVAGEPGGYLIDVNSEIRARVDTPGQTLANWWIRI